MNNKTTFNVLARMKSSATLMLTLFLLLSSGLLAQINYSQNFNAGSLSGWTSAMGGTFSSSWAHSTTQVCEGSGAARVNIYTPTTAGSFISPNAGQSIGTSVTMTYQYKVTNWSAGTVATPATFGSIAVQYASTLAGPWTTVETINSTNHVPSTSCATRTVTFTPPPSATFFVRFNCTYGTGDYWMDFDNVNITQQGPNVSIVTPVGTAGNTNGTGADPVDRYYNSIRYQVVYTAAELTAAGLVPNSDITKFAWNVTETSGTLGNYTIRMGHTTAATSAAHDNSATTIVKNPFAYTTALGYNDINLDVPFTWNGTSNLLVEICTGPANPFSSPYGGVASVAFTNGSRFYRTDGSSACGVNTSSTNGNKPLCRLTWVPGSGCSGTPAPGNTITSTPSVFPAGTASLSLQNATLGAGVTYQWQSAPTSTGAWTNVATGGTASSFTAAPTATTWYRCIVTCSGNSGTSAPVQVQLNPYCQPVYSSGTLYGDLISNVAISGPGLTWNNNSGTATTGPSYVSYTSLAPVVMQAATSYSMTVTAGSFSGQAFAVWIDANDDNVFSASEKVGFSTGTTTTSFGSVTFNINLPCTPPLGIHRMRVRGVWLGTGSTMDPCLSYGYGEAEDYLVQYVPGAPFTPSFTAAAPAQACTYIDYTYTTQSGMQNYAWTFPGTAGVDYTLVSGGTATSNTAVVKWLNAGAKTVGVNYNNASGCASAGPGSNTVTVQQTALVPNTVGALTVCAGSTATFTNTLAGGAWSSINPAVATVNPTTGVISGVAVGTTDIVYSVANPGTWCAASTNTKAITVNQTPVVNAGPDVTICTGASTNLNGSAQFVQTHTIELTDTYGDGWNGCSVNVLVNGTAVLSNITLASGFGPVSFTFGAQSGANIQVTFNSGSYPEETRITVLNGAGTTLVSNYSIGLAGPWSGVAGPSISSVWTPAATLTNANTATPTAAPQGTTTYTMSTTAANGCTGTDQILVTVLPTPAPQPVIAANGNTTFCAGGSVMLVAPPADSYVWSNGATTQTIPVTTAGNYFVTVNVGICSGTSSTVPVVVNALPATNITASATALCPGATATLSVPTAATYLWSNGAITPSIATSTAGTYSVTVTNANGCSATSAPVTLTAATTPTVTVTPNGPVNFCTGSSVVLNSNASAGSTFLWSNGATTQNITASTSGVYFVTVTNAAGCQTMSNNIVVNAQQTFTATATALSPTTVCQGTPVTLVASQGSSYLWSNGATTQGVNVTAGGPITVTVTNASGCTGTSAPINVTVLPVPNATINANGPLTFCQGSSVNLTATGGTTYSWSTGANTAAIAANASGNYVVTVTAANGCTDAEQVTVTVNAVPSSNVVMDGNSVLCPGETLTLSAAPGNTYAWSTGSTASEITVSNAGTYGVTVTGSNGCSSNSGNIIVSAGQSSASTIDVTALDAYTLNGVEYTTAGTFTQVIQNEAGCDSTITLNLTLTVGLDELNGVAYEVYPNPTADQFTIGASQAVYGAYSIQDAQGKIVKEGLMNGVSTTVELNEVARGIYFLRIAETSEAIRIIKN